MSALRSLAFLALTAGFSSSQTSDCSYLGLLNHLNLTGANDDLTIMRPVKNWTTATLIRMDMLLYGILEVNEKSQTVTSHIWIQMGWGNEFLTWNSSDFCGIDGLTVPRSKLWIPDVTIQEDASDTGSVQKSSFVSLFPSGLMFTNRRQRLTSTCQLKLFLFPFDIQHCNITFVSMNYIGGRMKLGTFNSDATLSSLSEEIMLTQGEWELGNMRIIEEPVNREGAITNKLVYMVKLKRKPMLYVINLIVPLFYFLVLDLASFFINDTRGEKLSFKVTVLLSISVLLLILQDILPSTEDRLPLVASYCIAVFTLVGISVLEAILVSFLMDLDDSCGKEAQISFDSQKEDQLEDNHKRESTETEETDQANPAQGHIPLDQPSDHDLLRLILKEVKAARQEAERQDRGKSAKPRRYKRLAEIIDSVFFVLYFIVIVIFLLCQTVSWFQNYLNEKD